MLSRRVDPWKALLRGAGDGGLLRYTRGMRLPVGNGLRTPLHSHRALEIVYHPTGRGTTRTRRGEEFAFGEGDVVVYAPGEAHDQHVTSAGEDLCLQIALPPGAFPDPTHRRAGSGVLVLSAHLPEAVRHDLRLLARPRPRPPTALERRALDLRATLVLLELLAHAERAGCPDPADADAVPPAAERHVQAAERFMAGHFAAVGSLREVAVAAGVGYDHLRHSFRERRGQSLGDHLRGLRLDHARRLLAHSRLGLKQVAAACGFRDEGYFSAVFRRHEGRAPGSYRRACS